MTPSPHFGTVAPSLYRQEGFLRNAQATKIGQPSFKKYGATGVSQKAGSPYRLTLPKGSRGARWIKVGEAVRQNVGKG